MKATLGTIDIICRDTVCAGEVLYTENAVCQVRQVVLRSPNGKIIYKPFATKDDALAWANRVGIEVSE